MYLIEKTLDWLLKVVQSLLTHISRRASESNEALSVVRQRALMCFGEVVFQAWRVKVKFVSIAHLNQNQKLTKVLHKLKNLKANCSII